MDAAGEFRSSLYQRSEAFPAHGVSTKSSAGSNGCAHLIAAMNSLSLLAVLTWAVFPQIRRRVFDLVSWILAIYVPCEVPEFKKATKRDLEIVEGDWVAPSSEAPSVLAQQETPSSQLAQEKEVSTTPDEWKSIMVQKDTDANDQKDSEDDFEEYEFIHSEDVTEEDPRCTL